MDILIVTYNWPPRSAIGTHRPYLWAREMLLAGHSVTVLTAKKQPFDEPLDLRLPALEGLKLVEVSYLRSYVSRNNLSVVARGGKPLIRGAKYLRGAALRFIGIAPEIRSLWYRASRSVVDGLCSTNRFDAVVSTFGPSAAHRIAKRVKDRQPHVVWVADFRDLWSGNPSRNGSSLGNVAVAMLERRICRRADLVTTVSNGLAASLADVHEGKKVRVVTNAFDSSPLYQLPVPTTGSSQVMEICYTGSIYEGLQDPAPLFAAIDQLIGSGVLETSGIKVSFYGARIEALRKAMAGSKADRYVQAFGSVPREIALDAQHRASALLLLEVLGATRGGVLTGKLFEYLAARRPIIAVGDGRDTELASVLSSTRSGVSLGNSVERIKHAILELKAGTVDWFEPGREAVACYSSTETSRRLLGFIEETRGARPAKKAVESGDLNWSDHQDGRE